MAHQIVRKCSRVEGEEAVNETVMERHQIPEVSLTQLQICDEWGGPGITKYKQNRASKINVFLFF
jgi:hypothetical protein